MPEIFSENLKKTPYFSSFDDEFYHSPDTFVHPSAILSPSVKVGSGVKIGPFVTITGNVIVADHVRIFPYVSIGAPAQNIGTKDALGSITIGAHTQIREFTSIHASKYEDGATTIGEHCYIMAYCHVAHDVVIGNYVTLINNVNLGGHSQIEERAVLMANSATHQFCRVGAYAALAPYSGIRQDIPPFGLYNGQPAAFAGLNTIGLKRAGFDIESRARIKKIMTLFFREKVSLEQLKESIDSDPLLHNDKHVIHFLSFITESITQARGVSRRVAQTAEQE